MSETPKPKIIHIQTEMGDIDPRTGRSKKPFETAIYGLRKTRAEQRSDQPPLPDAKRHPEHK